MVGQVRFVLAYDSTFPITIEQDDTANPASIQSKHSIVTSFTVGLHDRGKEFQVLGTGTVWESLYIPQGVQGSSISIFNDVDTSQFEDSDYLAVLPDGGDWSITVDDAIRVRTYANLSITNTLSIKQPNGTLIVDIPPLIEAHAGRDRLGNYLGYAHNIAAILEPYTQDFVNSDWISAELLITSSTHAQGVWPTIIVLDANLKQVSIGVEYQAAGSILLTVTNGSEFDGKVIIKA
jgi:hypothetical protein